MRIRGMMMWWVLMVSLACACTSKGEPVAAGDLMQKWAKAPEVRAALEAANAQARGYSEAIRAIQVQAEMFVRDARARVLEIAKRLEAQARAKAAAKAKAKAAVEAEVADKPKEPVPLPAPPK